MTELTKSSQTNGKYLSKAKSANKPLATTKPCSHECTLDFRNAKTLDVGNAKPQIAGTTSDAQECQALDGRNDLRRQKRQTLDARNANPLTPIMTLEARNVIPLDAKPLKQARNAKP